MRLVLLESQVSVVRGLIIVPDVGEDSEILARTDVLAAVMQPRITATLHLDPNIRIIRTFIRNVGVGQLFVQHTHVNYVRTGAQDDEDGDLDQAVT